MKPRLCVSFSGGRTSAFMSIWLKQNMSDKYDMRFVFANTGQEHSDTLRFVNEVDSRFALNVVWVESLVYPKGRASGHKIVTFKTASRDGEPFEAMCAKYGLPNQTFQHCTRELKKNPINSFLRSIGWRKNTYTTAIGIRSDEPRRVRRDSMDRDRIVYPLVDWVPTDKETVLVFFEDLDWDLKIGEHDGNCRWCYKKSEKKLHRISLESPHVFAFPAKLDALYAGVGPNCVPGPRKMFRGYRTTLDLLESFKDAQLHPLSQMEGACSESCEVDTVLEVRHAPRSRNQ